MTTMAGFVRTLAEEDIPVTLTDDHSASSYGQPVVVMCGRPHSPLDLVSALRPASRIDTRDAIAARYAVLISLAGTGKPIYFTYDDTWAANIMLQGGARSDVHAVPPINALADPADHIAYTPTDDEWRLVAAAKQAGYLVHISPTYLVSDAEYGRRQEEKEHADH